MACHANYQCNFQTSSFTGPMACPTQVSTYPCSFKSCGRPCSASMDTAPSRSLTLQVPHCPCLQPEGMLTPHRCGGLREINGGVRQVDFLKRDAADIGVANEICPDILRERWCNYSKHTHRRARKPKCLPRVNWKFCKACPEAIHTSKLTVNWESA